MTRQHTCFARSALVGAVILLAGFATQAWAGGHVVQIDGKDIYVDLGAAEGVGAQTELTLMHVVMARDPITQKTLRDTFAIGRLVVLKAGEHLSLARAPDELLARIKLGDEVELFSPARVFEDPWVNKSPSPESPGAPAEELAGESIGDDAESERRFAQQKVDQAHAVRAAWRDTLGRAPDQRIVVWQNYLERHGDSEYAATVREEIRRLAQQAEEERAAAKPEDTAEQDEDRIKKRVRRLRALEPHISLRGVLAGRSPTRAYEATDLELSFTVLRPAAVQRAWLYYRQDGEASYQRAAMRLDGDGYLRGTIPAAVVKPPAVDYFVESLGGEGAEPRAVMGSQNRPVTVSVDARVEESAPDLDDRSRVTVFMDYVDFDGSLASGFDQYLQAEIDFMYRFLGPVYSMRVGFGTMGGVGGPKDVIDGDTNKSCRDENGQYQCRRVSFNYAYTELEFRHSELIAFMVRPQFGFGSSDKGEGADQGRCFLGEEEPDCDLFSSFGLRGRVRIGDERETNLTLGVGFAGNVGTLFEAAFTWDVMPLFPVVLTAQVTDQPVPEDFGVRLITEIGWRSSTPWVFPSFRLSYQARDVDHAGVSGGLALNFDW